jgi:plasmid maintenance system antidote protein VapI
MLVPPGEVLLEEFLRPLGISQYRLAQEITADTDLRLCRFFGLSDGFWLRMQGSHNLKLARQALISVLPAIEPIHPMA